MSYTEALKYLAKKYHIEVVEKEETAEEIAQRQRHESLFLVSEYAGKFFQDSMQTQEGQAIAYQYFKSRGLEDETINILGLDIPVITIPVHPGRNLAIILEIAAMNNRQKRMGYNTAEEFNKRLMGQMGIEM